MQESNNQKFNHLKIHTQYSICEGAIKIDSLKDFCKERKIRCVGLSDTSNSVSYTHLTLPTICSV